MQFNEYLALKKIDAQHFQCQDPVLYTEWKCLFEQIHPDSFTTLKKFLLNNVRRRHHLL